ncbi:MAG TPA: hypothetical protein PK413_10555, partial [Thermoanaerobaculia bacterium]|nr:hypothetical protein [Thermoanaerobaculia bacterium]
SSRSCGRRSPGAAAPYTSRVELLFTQVYLRRVEKLLSEIERRKAEDLIALDPTRHPVIPGTGGLRKARVSRSGAG